jgi:hypothetical protein
MRLRLIGFVLFELLASACATDQAAKLRQERPYTVGYLGAAYRPQDNLAINLSADIRADASGSGSISEMRQGEEDRNISLTGHKIGISALYFPKSTSAFFVGAGILSGSGSVKFDGKKTNSDEKTKVTYDRSASYIGIPLGWYWIWDNGFTLALDFGPNLRISHSQKIRNSGGVDVDTSDRDKTIGKIEDKNKITLGGRGLFGYSF